MPPIITMSGVSKSYGSVVALDDVDLSVEEGSIHGMLGPNGAGKTTSVRILTTLLRPDTGSATVAGHDVVADAAALRFEIGLAGQYAAVDEILTGRENLEMVGRLYRLGSSVAKQRAGQILERFGLTHAADRQVKTYSGGMRRRLDLAASLVGEPKVLFLDEPTTGLDPRSRLALWDFIETLVDQGTTLMLTTQYLEEADRLADRISVIDNGRVIAEGTASHLKGQIGGTMLHVEIEHVENLQRARGALADLGSEASIDESTRSVHVTVGGREGVITEAVRRLDQAGVAVLDLALREPTLDDVFLTLTGHEAEPGTETEMAEPARGRRP